MAVGDWIANLFQSDETRGLSGGAAGAVALDDSNPYYNYRLRRHAADGDLVREPQLLWHTSSHVKRRAGLGIHIAAEKGEGVASFTDVLLILSREDYKEALGSDPKGGWLQKASLTLLQEFEDYCKRQGFSRLYDHRQLGFKIICDGSEEMGGQLLELDKGEFITGLLPNLYTGPVRGSHPVIGVHVNLPGAWEGYREVGRLYNDQILFTLGNHWLDNFSHPHLREAALYRLQQYPDGGTVHIINPDLQGKYQVTSTNQGGASVLTIATRDGEPLAYLVLAVIEEEEAAEEAPPPVKPGIDMPTAPKPTLKEGGYTIPPPMVLEESAEPKRPAPVAESLSRQAVGSVAGHKTIIPDAVEDRIFTLQERGALLQKVHFGAFMEGYDVYVGQRGDMGTAVEDPAAIFQVRRRSVSFISNVVDAKVDGEAVEPGEEIAISKDVTIEVAGQKFEYRDLRGETADGWPYVGEIRRPTSSNYLMWGESYQVGRSRECRVVLPDEPRNDNIHWKAKIGDGATIRARTGEIPKSRFYTDSIMVASEHGEIDLTQDDPRVRCTARHCYVYVRRGPEVLPLFPTKSGKEPLEMLVEPGDEVLIGNCLFKVGYTPVEEAVAPAPAPDIDLTADSLVDAVSAPDLAELEQPAVQEPPAAAGLGEKKGPAPEPLPVEATDADSILGTPVAQDEQADIRARLSQSLKKKLAAVSEPPVEEKEEVLDVYEGEVEPIEEIPGVGDEEAEPEPAEQVELGQPGRFQDGDFDLPDFSDEPEPVAEDSWDALDTGAAADETDADTEVLRPLTDVPVVEEEWPAEEQAEAPTEEQARWVEDEEWDLEAPEGAPPEAEGPPPAEEAEAPAAEEEEWEEEEGGEWEEEEEEEWEEEEEEWEEEEEEWEEEEEEWEEEPAEEQAPEKEPLEEEAPEEEPLEEEAPEEEPLEEEAPAEEAEAPARQVVFMDDSAAQFELSRRMQVLQIGWMVKGGMVCGNHTDADLIVPENRMVEDQEFEPMDYFRLQVRGRRGSLELIAATEVLVDGDDPAQAKYDDPEKHVLDVIRRDDQGEEDFAVRMQLGVDPTLPDPRAKILEMDVDDPLAAALFTRGLPAGQPRTLKLHGITLTFTHDEDVVVVSDYLATYKRPGGYAPFFVQKGEERYQTAPENGEDIHLQPGDRFVIEHAIYEIVEQ